MQEPKQHYDFLWILTHNSPKYLSEIQLKRNWKDFFDYNTQF